MRRWIRILIGGVAFLCVVVVPNRVVDVLAGCLIVLWLPGAAWSDVLLGRRPSRWWEQLAVAVLLSASLSILIGLLLDTFPAGLDRRTELIAWFIVIVTGLVVSELVAPWRKVTTDGDSAGVPDRSSSSSFLQSISRMVSERKWALASGLATFALFAIAIGSSLISSHHGSAKNPIAAISALPVGRHRIEVLATSTSASSKPYAIVLSSSATPRQVLRAEIGAGKPWVHVVTSPTFPFRAQLWQSGPEGSALVSQIRLVGE